MASTSTASNVPGPSSMNKEQEKEKGYSVLSRGRRPSPPPRQPSYSKRHASIDSPREIPLPSPSPHVQGNQTEYSYFDVPTKPPKSPRKLTHTSSKEREKDVFSPVFEEDFEGSEWTAVDKRPVPNLSLQTKSRAQGIPTPPYTGSSSHLYQTHSPLGLLGNASQQIHPYPRPYSLPHTSSSSGSGGSTVGVGSSVPSSDGETTSAPRLARHWTDEGQSTSTDIYNSDFGFGKGNREVDRSSSASLPLPSQIPYHTLPRVGHSHQSDVGRLRELVSEVARSRVPESTVEEADEVKPNTSDNSSTLPPTSSQPPSSRKSKSPMTFPPPSLDGAPTTSDLNATSSANTSIAGTTTFSSDNLPNDSPAQYLNSIIDATAYATALRRRPLSVRSSESATLPPPEPPVIHPPSHPTYTVNPLLHEPSLEPTSHASPSENLTQPPPAPTPITNPSELPPVLPPSRTRKSIAGDIRSESAGSSPHPASSSSSGSSGGPYSGGLVLSTSSSSAPGSSGQPATRGSSPSPSNAPPPYAPFLSHMPPPADSWIEVETTPTEYKLNIRLPGFKRDGITLATKRRRILHVVADSWPDTDGGSSAPQRGGHFERRISFGYDADLVGVRAEFDGEMLKIVVPRRQE